MKKVYRKYVETLFIGTVVAQGLCETMRHQYMSILEAMDGAGIGEGTRRLNGFANKFEKHVRDEVDMSTHLHACQTQYLHAYFSDWKRDGYIKANLRQMRRFPSMVKDMLDSQKQDAKIKAFMWAQK